MWNFNWHFWDFTQKCEPIHRKICILLCSFFACELRCLSIVTSYALVRRVPAVTAALYLRMIRISLSKKWSHWNATQRLISQPVIGLKFTSHFHDSGQPIIPLMITNFTFLMLTINSMSPGRSGCYTKLIIFKLISRFNIFSISREMTL